MERILNVYLYHHLVGQLTQNQNGQIQFSYDPKWLQSKSPIPLSHSLPLRKEPFQQKECRSFFAGIIPEDTNRKIIAQILGINAHNDYAMLEKIGGECAGAVTFIPKGTTFPKPSSYKYQILNDTDLIEILKHLPKNPLLAGKGLRLSLAGAQDKITVHIDQDGRISLPLNGAPSTHILKPAIKRFPNSTINEALCLNLAKSIGIPTVDAVMKSIGSITYLLVKRYDRKKDKNTKYPIRLHQEDFCQALGIPPEYKHQNEGGPGLKDCFDLLRRVSNLPAVDLKNLLNTVIFNIIIGNHDAHGKNFSLLFDTTKDDIKIRLAPVYDILSTIYYPELTSKMAMKIGKEYESSQLNLRNIERFAVDAGLGVAAIRKQIIQVAQNVKSNILKMKNSYKQVDDLVMLIDKRATWIIKLINSS